MLKCHRVLYLGLQNFLHILRHASGDFGIGRRTVSCVTRYFTDLQNLGYFLSKIGFGAEPLHRPGVDRDYNLDADEAASYHTAAFYPTGGALFERLRSTDARWADLPEAIACKVRHLGHMSWAAT